MKSKPLYPYEKRLLRFVDKKFKNVSNGSIGISLIKFIFQLNTFLR